MTDSRGPLLLIDQGSHATKAFLVREERWSRGEAPVATRRDGPRVEHDAEALVASVHEAVAAALRHGGLTTGERLRVGLATQRSTVACWDARTGEALGPVISWQDRRHAAWLDGLGLDAGEIRRITGLVPSPHYGASKLRWCLDHQPEVRRALGAGRLCMGPLSSFLLFRLLAERPFVVDPANASRTLLWDVTARDWSSALLASFRIPRETLPACVPSRYRFGTLEAGGVSGDLAVCTGDQAAALFAWGKPSAETAYVNIGTGAFVQRPVDGEPPSVSGLLHSVAWQDRESTLGVLEATVNGAGAAIDWLAAELAVEPAVLIGRAGDWLGEVGDPPLFINGVGGLGAPFWVPGCPVRFEGPGGMAEKTVAVLESIVFLAMAGLEVMADSIGPAERIVVTGGLARLDGLCQRLAGLSGLPVERPGEIEATAAGLAWLLGQARARPPASGTRFEPGGDSGLAARYGRWRRALEAAIRG